MTEKEKIKNVIIGAINDNAEALEKLKYGNVLLNEDENKTYWSYLIGRRVALFECYLILEESDNGKN